MGKRKKRKKRSKARAKAEKKVEGYKGASGKSKGTVIYQSVNARLRR